VIATMRALSEDDAAESIASDLIYTRQAASRVGHHRETVVSALEQVNAGPGLPGARLPSAASNELEHLLRMKGQCSGDNGGIVVSG
jgi:hypothetical protein